ncbi:MAG: hypothetical protein R3Y46_03555 [Opitutales bacterium]
MKKISLFILSILTLSNLSFAEIITCKSPTCNGHSHNHSHSEEEIAELVTKAKALDLDKFIIKGEKNTISICENAIISINNKAVEQENLDALFTLFTENETIYFTANHKLQMQVIYSLFDKIRNCKAKLTSIQ